MLANQRELDHWIATRAEQLCLMREAEEADYLHRLRYYEECHPHPPKPVPKDPMKTDDWRTDPDERFDYP